MSSEPSRPICVLSIGRSGTSLVARVINVLGIDLGSEDTMLEATDANPRGFWEQREVVELNDEILAALGGSYHDPPERPPGWETTPEMERFRTGIKELVARQFGRGLRWGFKDPRTAMTVPLWRAALGEFDYIICVRNPLEVAASLEPVVPAGIARIDLWLTYMCEALRHTAGRRRAFVFYEDWFADPMAVSRRLAVFLHGTPELMDGAAQERIRDFFEPALRRQRVEDLTLAEHAGVPVAARALHLLMRCLAAAEENGTDQAPALQAVASALDDHIAVARAHAEDRNRLAADLDARVATLAAMQSSVSWRITRPLRDAKRRVSRRRPVAT
jgi:hypothetical protein